MLLGDAGWVMAGTASTTSTSVCHLFSTWWETMLMRPVVVVYDNGKSGFLGEHSCMDGTPTLRMNEFMLAGLAAGKIDMGAPRTASTSDALPEPKELKFELDEASKANIKAAEQRFDELVGKHDLHVSAEQPHQPLATQAVSNLGPELRRIWKRSH